MSSNAAAWLTAEKSYPFDIKEAPAWTPEDGEVLVKVRAVAINPADGYQQASAYFPMKYPAILGMDVAGEVEKTGPDVTEFKEGDRVLGSMPGIITGQPRECGFQSFVIMKKHMVSEIPDSISFEQASVLPLAVATASCGLFQDAPHLALQYPTEPARSPTGSAILIWGGGSSVGSCGIQLAKAAGYEVITTASPKNFDYTKRLGAKEVFDYNDPDVVNNIIEACRGKEFVGALDCIGGSATTACQQVLQQVKGIKVVATAKHPKGTLEGVEVAFILGTTLKDNAVGPAVFRDFLPKALKAGSFIPAPDADVVGKGLESIQKGVDLIQKGVSAKKLVVSL